jgi:hypothetical protein
MTQWSILISKHVKAIAGTGQTGFWDMGRMPTSHLIDVIPEN